jgi:hypothetical protein
MVAISNIEAGAPYETDRATTQLEVILQLDGNSPARPRK